MNYKRKHRATKRRLRARERKSKGVASWTYGRAIAKEIVERREFRTFT